MNDALLIAVIMLIALAVMVWLIRSIWREVHDLRGGQDEPQTERRKNEKIRKEIEAWRDGE
jgi:1,4-dihydroxy-2-naphthoate octaprenyltransferase